jgi:hypothetical protein
MTRVHFQHRYAKFNAWKSSATQRLQEYVVDEGAVLAPYIRLLHIQLSESEFSPMYDGTSISPCEESEEWAISSKANVSTVVLKLEDAFCRLPKLERLAITMEEKWRSEVPPLETNSQGYCVVEDDEDDEDCGRPSEIFDLGLLCLIRSNVARVFSSPRIQLPFLNDLRLKLPSVYDLATIGANISDDVVMQLQHLYLEYIDGTGPDGDKMYTEGWVRVDDPYGDNDCHIYSNLQKRFPNTEHMSDLCNFISRCHNLKSLSVSGTQFLDLDSLVWRPTSTGLENLHIYRGAASASTLISLLSPSASAPAATSNIVNLKIFESQLEDGIWSTVFEHLMLSPSLVYIDVDDLVYNEYGKSGQYHSRKWRPWEDRAVMWTKSEQDARSLVALARLMQERGGQGRGLESSLDDGDLAAGTINGYY